MHYQLVQNMLERSIYAGYIDAPKWDISLHPAKHEPLITFEEWQKIQQRLKEKAKAPARKDLHQDFPLRGFISCGCCGKPLTSCWSKGRSNTYAYYHCHNRDCVDYKKSVRKEKVEQEFEALLLEIRPTQELFYVAKEMFRKLWEERGELSLAQAKLYRQELGKIDKKVEQFLERILDADNHTVIKTYENQVRKLEEEKIMLSENIAQCGRPLPDFDETFRTAALAQPFLLLEDSKHQKYELVVGVVRLQLFSQNALFIQPSPTNAKSNTRTHKE